jgi:hypothetical protein
MRTTALLLAPFAILLGAMPARGQSAFVGGGAASNSIWFAHSESQSPVISNSDTSGRTTDWFITGGGVVARHAVLQAELSFGSKLSTEIPPPRYVPGYPATPGTQKLEYTYQFKHGAVLGGYTTGTSRRVNLSALAGVAFMQTIRHGYSSYTPPIPPPVPIYPSEDTFVAYSIAPVFGLDVPIQAAPHLVLVPQVRTWKIASGGPLSLSFGAGARVTF